MAAISRPTRRRRRAKPAHGHERAAGVCGGVQHVPHLAMASLITSMRMFETNQKVMQMQSDRMTKAITDLSGAN